MIKLLQKYLSIDTSYPNPDYLSVIELFRRQALEDGFLATEILLPSGNPVLILTLLGSSPELPSLALNHHMDVVPVADSALWKFPPFAGTLHDSRLYGRGTQDCKGLGVAHYAALKKFRESGIQQERTVHCIFAPDEERGGFHGTKEFVEHPIFSSLNIGYVLDEGQPSGNDKHLLIKVNERTPLQFRVTSKGKQSHASGLLNENCIHDLINFLADVADIQCEQRAVSKDEAGSIISMNITSLRAGDVLTFNVIPDEAFSIIDMRIPSQISLEEGIAFIDRMIQKRKNIKYEVIATSKERHKPESQDSTLYKTVAQAVAHCGFIAQPLAFEGTTDSRFYSHKGIQSIGITPFCIAPNLHGTNECIYVRDLEQARDIFYTILCAICTESDKGKI